MTHANRVLAYVLAVLAIAVVAVILIVTTVKGASAAGICERHGMQKVFTRGGRSWRCKRVRYAALRMRPKGGDAIANDREPTGRGTRSRGNIFETTPRQQGDVAEAQLVRTVRTIPITNGLTPGERIERAFDKLIIFPIEDEP